MTHLTDFRDPTYPDRPGGFMFTYSGTHYFPFDPRPEDVHILDIAHHLAQQCRFNGACLDFYSVAEHCIHASYIVPPEHALEALMHDAAEAYLGDLIRPLKYVPELGDFYRKVEELNERVIAQRFGLKYPWHPEIKKADEAMVTLEIAELVNIGMHAGRYYDATVTAKAVLFNLSPLKARQYFLDRFHELNALRRMKLVDESMDVVEALHGETLAELAK